MKKEVFILFWVWAIFFSSNVWGNGVTLVWKPNGVVTSSTNKVTFFDNAFLNQPLNVTLPSNTRPMSVAFSKCTIPTGSKIPGKLDGSRGVFFQYEEGWKTTPSGLEYQVTSNGWSSIGPGILSNKVAVPAGTFFGGTCLSPGSTYDAVGPFDAALVKVPLSISIARGSALPGHYNINIPFKWLYQEVKFTPGYHYTTGGMTSSEANNAFLNTKVETANISVEVRSSCSLSSYDTINLSHGRITSKEAVGHKSRPYSIEINCSGATSARLKLSGSSPISGASPNLTQCGPSGSCELLFDNNTHDQEIFIDGSKKISISSTYNPIGKVQEGSFNGSGIFTFEVL
ncbi:hypothetical protein [Photobacterium damselae]|uniref:hypothetical protein n=1 Tax=Photobacterium damselae TaxID=38293 RepID=UPI004068B915